MLACGNLAERFSVPIDQAHAAIYESGLEHRFEHGEITGEQFASEIRRQLGREASEMPTPAVLDAVSDMFTPIDSMLAVLHKVRERGLGIGLLSNTCHAHWDWISRQKYAVMQFSFDVTILSFEVGSMKPDGPIYDAAERAAVVPANRILFLDDKKENVDAALGRDWNAVRCLGGDEAISALRSFRVMSASP
jgi:HAD superfamily hydrolase (TIGR01509 family)